MNCYIAGSEIQLNDAVSGGYRSNNVTSFTPHSPVPFFGVVHAIEGKTATGVDDTPYRPAGTEVTIADAEGDETRARVGSHVWRDSELTLDHNTGRLVAAQPGGAHVHAIALERGLPGDLVRVRIAPHGLTT